MEQDQVFRPVGRAVTGLWSGRPAGSGGRPNLDIADFSPRLLLAYLFGNSPAMQSRRRLENRPVLDYEMEFILESSGSQIIDGTEHPVRRGDLVFRRPGQRTQGILPYSCLTIIFDLEGRYRPRPIPYFQGWAAPEGSWQAQPDFRNPFLDRLQPVFHPAAGDIFRSLFETSLKHFISPGEGSELLRRASILQILYHLNAEIRDPLPQLPAGQGSHHQKLEAVLAYMRRHFRRKLPLQELGGVAGLSPTYLHRVFTEIMGETPLDHLNRLRMEAARDLLATSDLSAKAVALEVGFDNVPYFFTLFRKSSGMTPAAFRQRHRFLP